MWIKSRTIILKTSAETIAAKRVWRDLKDRHTSSAKLILLKIARRVHASKSNRSLKSSLPYLSTSPKALIKPLRMIHHSSRSYRWLILSSRCRVGRNSLMPKIPSAKIQPKRLRVRGNRPDLEPLSSKTNLLSKFQKTHLSRLNPHQCEIDWMPRTNKRRHEIELNGSGHLWSSRDEYTCSLPMLTK